MMRKSNSSVKPKPKTTANKIQTNMNPYAACVS